MKIHEYQAKKLFAEAGITVPRGYAVSSPVAAEFAYDLLKTKVAVVKGQIHAGGRGKAGGVLLAKSSAECREKTEELIGKVLYTPQTGPEGKKVHQVYVEAGSEIAKEYYLAMLLDRESASIAIIFSTQGGMDIEEVAATSPELITNVQVDPGVGLMAHHLRALTGTFKLPKEEIRELGALLKRLLAMFIAKDFSLLEINPLVVDAQGTLLPLDGKMIFDDNALFRQPEIAACRDFREEDSREVEASKYGLSYIGLGGNIGCMVNGAGLAMATMDIIKLYGGEPANFLDVGGGADEEMVTQGFRIILQDAQVKGVFVNIFGGIMRCDVIARGILAAAANLHIKVPLVVRLQGTNMEEGRQLLAASDLDVVPAEHMSDGAAKITEAVA